MYKLLNSLIKKFCFFIVLCGASAGYGENPHRQQFSEQAYRESQQTLLEHLKKKLKRRSNEAKKFAYDYLRKGLSEENFDKIRPYMDKTIIPGLTWSHLAVIKEDHALVAFLHSQGVSFTTKYLSLTPAHFTALHYTRDTLDLLDRLGLASSEVKNKFDGSPGQSFVVTHLLADAEQKIQFWDAQAQEFSIVDGEAFKDIHGFSFLESTKVPPKLYVQYVLGERQVRYSEVEKQIQQKNAKQHFKNFSPRNYTDFYLEGVDFSIDNRTCDNDKQQWALHTSRSFFPGEVIDTFAGLISFSPRANNEYSMDDVNCEFFHGYMAMANDGFPNAISFQVTNFHGLPEGVVLVALREILPGEEITFNYVSHDVKLAHYFENDPRSMDAWIDQHQISSVSETMIDSLKKIFTFKEQEDTQSPTWIVYFQLIHSMAYLLNTPQVFLRLTLEEKIAETDFLLIYEDKNLVEIMERSALDSSILLEMADAVKSWKQSQYKDKISAFFHQKMQEHGAMLSLVNFVGIKDLINKHNLLGNSQDIAALLEDYWQQTQKTYCDFVLKTQTGNELKVYKKRFECPL